MQKEQSAVHFAKKDTTCEDKKNNLTGIFTMNDKTQCVTLRIEFCIFNKTINRNADLLRLRWSHLATANSQQRQVVVVVVTPLGCA